MATANKFRLSHRLFFLLRDSCVNINHYGSKIHNQYDVTSGEMLLWPQEIDLIMIFALCHAPGRKIGGKAKLSYPG